MLDIGWQELFFIAVLALIVVGPKDLPAAMRTLARLISKLRGLSREFQDGVSDMVREAELDELKQKMQQVQRFDVREQVKNSIDPDGNLRDAFDPTGMDDHEDKRSGRKPADSVDDVPTRPVNGKVGTGSEAEVTRPSHADR